MISCTLNEANDDKRQKGVFRSVRGGYGEAETKLKQR